MSEITRYIRSTLERQSTHLPSPDGFSFEAIRVLNITGESDIPYSFRLTRQAVQVLELSRARILLFGSWDPITAPDESPDSLLVEPDIRTMHSALSAIRSFTNDLFLKQILSHNESNIVYRIAEMQVGVTWDALAHRARPDNPQSILGVDRTKQNHSFTLGMLRASSDILDMVADELFVRVQRRFPDEVASMTEWC